MNHSSTRAQISRLGSCIGWMNVALAVLNTAVPAIPSGPGQTRFITARGH